MNSRLLLFIASFFEFSVCFHCPWPLDSVRWFLTNSRLLLFVLFLCFVQFPRSLVSRLRRVVPEELPASTLRRLLFCFVMFPLSLVSRLRQVVPDELPASTFRCLFLCFSLCVHFIWSPDSVTGSPKWFARLVRPTASHDWFAQLVRPTGSPNRFARLVRPTGSPEFFARLEIVVAEA